MSLKPTFTDLEGRKVFARLVDIDGSLRLSLQDENNETLLLLNFYDAKQLVAACNLFLNQRFAANLGEIDGNMSLKDRDDVFDEELEKIADKLKEEAAAEKARRNRKMDGIV